MLEYSCTVYTNCLYVDALDFMCVLASIHTGLRSFACTSNQDRNVVIITNFVFSNHLKFGKLSYFFADPLKF